MKAEITFEDACPILLEFANTGDREELCKSLDWQSKYIWPKLFKLTGFDCILLDSNIIDVLLDKDISKTKAKHDVEIYSDYESNEIGKKFAIVCATVIRELNENNSKTN